MAEPGLLGCTESGSIAAIDVVRLVETHLGIVGMPGAGKSRTIRKVLELAAGGPQRIVLDVEDEFYTLREASPSLILAGGSNGDCPATVENAAALARFLLETGTDAVVQLNDLGLTGQRAFVARFLEAMISAPTELWHSALVVLDEAHRYAPEGAPAESSSAVVSLLMQGRKRGFGALVATQRLAKVSKDVTGAVNNWMMGRAGQTIDRRAVADMMGVRLSDDEAKGLPRLRPGQFWGFGPAISIEPVLIQVGDVATTHLRAGQRDVPTPPAPEQIRAMLARLQVAPQPNAESGASAAAPGTAELAAAERRGYERGIEEGRRQEAAESAELIQERQTAIEAALGHLAPFSLAVPSDGIALSAAPEQTTVLTQAPSRATRPRAAERPMSSGRTDGLHSAAGKLLTASAQHAPARFTWGQLATLAGLKPSGGHFNAGRKELRDQGLIGEEGGLVAATSLGIAVAGPTLPAPSSPEERLTMWCDRLPSPAPEMLRALSDRGSEELISAEVLAERIGKKPSGGHWNSGIAVLRNNGLIEAVGRSYRIAPLLRDEGVAPPVGNGESHGP